MTHPYDYEAPPLSTDYDAIHAHQDATRDLPMATVHLVPPLAAYDIHAKLVDAIWTSDGFGGGRYSHGLRAAYRIVFGEDAP